MYVKVTSEDIAGTSLRHSVQYSGKIIVMLSCAVISLCRHCYYCALHILSYFTCALHFVE